MKMHWCTARVNLAGQNFTVIVVEEQDPISWPEAQVLIALHGEENVFNIKACRISDGSPSDEKRRLLGKYGPIVERVFPGRVFRMEMTMPAEEGQFPLVDGDGQLVPVSAALDGDAAEYQEEPAPEPPPTEAVFKPGRHRAPAGPM